MNSAPTTPSLALGDCFALVGEHHRVFATAQNTGGTFFGMEMTISPGGGTPPHVHTREDEAFFLLAGEVEFFVAGQPRRLQPGEFVFGPRGIPHHFRNVGPAPARLQVLAFPATAGHFFAAAGRRLSAEEPAIPPPSAEEIARVIAVAADHGITILLPPR